MPNDTSFIATAKFLSFAWWFKPTQLFRSMFHFSLFLILVSSLGFTIQPGNGTIDPPRELSANDLELTSVATYEVDGCPDTFIAASGNKGLVQIWNASSGRLVRTIEANVEGSRLLSVVVDPSNGDVQFVTAGRDRVSLDYTLKVWSSKSERALRTSTVPYGFIRDIEAFVDPKTQQTKLAITLQNGNLSIFSLQNLDEPIDSVSAHSSFVGGLTVIPKQNGIDFRIVTGAADSIKVWRLFGNELVLDQTLLHSQQSITCLGTVIGQDDALYVISGGPNNAFHLQPISGLESTRVISTRSSPIQDVTSFVLNGRAYILSAALNSAVEVWSLDDILREGSRTGSLVTTQDVSVVNSIATYVEQFGIISKAILVSAGKSLWIWDTGLRITQSPTLAPTSVPSFSPSLSPMSAGNGTVTVPPTSSPTFAPNFLTRVTRGPTRSPTYSPTENGTTSSPSSSPTPGPSTLNPSSSPSESPSSSPTTKTFEVIDLRITFVKAEFNKNHLSDDFDDYLESSILRDLGTGSRFATLLKKRGGSLIVEMRIGIDYIMVYRGDDRFASSLEDHLLDDIDRATQYDLLGKIEVKQLLQDECRSDFFNFSCQDEIVQVSLVVALLGPLLFVCSVILALVQSNDLHARIECLKLFVEFLVALLDTLTDIIFAISLAQTNSPLTVICVFTLSFYAVAHLLTMLPYIYRLVQEDAERETKRDTCCAPSTGGCRRLNPARGVCCTSIGVLLSSTFVYKVLDAPRELLLLASVLDISEDMFQGALAAIALTSSENDVVSIVSLIFSALSLAWRLLELVFSKLYTGYGVGDDSTNTGLQAQSKTPIANTQGNPSANSGQALASTSVLLHSNSARRTVQSRCQENALLFEDRVRTT